MVLNSKWKPVLHDKLLENAQEIIFTIADSLIEVHAVPIDQALFFGYLYLATGNSYYLTESRKRLDRALDSCPKAISTIRLFGGLAGIGWIMDHLKRYVFMQEVDEDFMQEVDEILLNALEEDSWSGHYDLIQGVVGIGVYFLERYAENKVTKNTLERIFYHIVNLAEIDTNGARWYVSPNFIDSRALKNYPDGRYDFGVAHGIPAVIAMIARLIENQVLSREQLTFFHNSLTWFFTQKNNNNEKSMFPTFISPGNKSRNQSRIAWCYGDMGISTVLYQSGNCVGDKALMTFAEELADKCMARPYDETGIVDAGLCHGSSGVAHMFSRLFHSTGYTKYQDAAVFWFIKTMDLRRKTGLAGYQSLTREGENKWVNDPTFIAGVSGIGLALIAATTTIEPKWDKLLLLS